MKRPTKTTISFKGTLTFWWGLFAIMRLPVPFWTLFLCLAFDTSISIIQYKLDKKKALLEKDIYDLKST